MFASPQNLFKWYKNLIIRFYILKVPEIKILINALLKDIVQNRVIIMLVESPIYSNILERGNMSVLYLMRVMGYKTIILKHVLTR